MQPISVYDLGLVPYEEALGLQETLARGREEERGSDALLLLQHPPVISYGQAGGQEDILVSATRLAEMGIVLSPCDRGGKATYHGPGQLVAYPIMLLPDNDLHAYVHRLEEVALRVLAAYGVTATRDDKYPGLWVNRDKIAAVGIAIRQGITRHGLSLNISPQLEHYKLLVHCGISGRGVTSLERLLGRRVPMEEVVLRFGAAFGQVFGRPLQPAGKLWQDSLDLPTEQSEVSGHPPWLRRRVHATAEQAIADMDGLLSKAGLRTVCSEAHCPNIADCYARGTATFLILGDTCTRGCRFCAIKHGRPADIDAREPQRIAQAAALMQLRHVVVTSVTRDDVPDGGSRHFAQVVAALRERLPDSTVELLVPDFAGSCSALDLVLSARPDVLNHNVETVPRLYPSVRPAADYHRSLGVLSYAKSHSPGTITKSGLMLGLGERPEEVQQVLHDLSRARCDLLTLGQYLQPTAGQTPVSRYLTPAEFNWYRQMALAAGFRAVAAGPLVRSSHQAAELLGRAV